MKRPLWLAGLLLMLAVTVAFLLPWGTLLPLSLAFAITGVFAFIVKKQWSKTAVLCCFSVALGLCISLVYTGRNITPFKHYIGKTITIEGVVLKENQTSQRGRKYEVYARFIETDLPDAIIIIRDYSESGLAPGEKAALRVKMQTPKHKSTAESQMKKGIPAEGTLTELVERLPLKGAEKPLVKIVRLREAIYNKINSVLAKETASVVNGMVFGKTQDIPPEIYNALNKAGTSHLLSVSGMHLSIFTGFILWLLSFLPLPRTGRYLLAIAGAGGFAAVVGLSAPIVRAFVMTAVFILGQIFYRKNSSINSLGLAGIIIAVMFPYWCLSYGTWLSFLSTAGIILFSGKISRRLEGWLKYRKKSCGRLAKGLIGGISVTAGAYVLSFPVLVLMSGWLTVLAPIVNILIAPFSAVVIVLGVLVAVLPVGFPFYSVICSALSFSCKMITGVSGAVARLPMAVVAFDDIYKLLGFAGAVAAAVVGLVLSRRKKRVAVATAAVMVLCFFGGVTLSGLSCENTLELAVICEGELALLKRGESAVIIGTPNTYNINRLISYLDFRGVKYIDCLVAADHNENGGTPVIRLAESVRIKAIVGPDDSYILEEMSKSYRGIPVYSCGYASLKVLDCAQFDFHSNGIISITAGKHKIMHRAGKHDIMKPDIIYLNSKDSELTLPKGVTIEPNPLGKRIFDEERILLDI